MLSRIIGIHDTVHVYALTRNGFFSGNSSLAHTWPLRDFSGGDVKIDINSWMVIVCLKVHDNFSQSVYFDQIVEFGVHNRVNNGFQSFSELKFES